MPGEWKLKVVQRWITMGSAQAKLTSADILPATPAKATSDSSVAESVNAVTADLARINAGIRAKNAHMSAHLRTNEARMASAIDKRSASMDTAATKLRDFNQKQVEDICKRSAAFERQVWDLEGKLNTARDLCGLRQGALDNLIRRLEVHLPDWEKKLAGELIWPCDICVALHAKESGSVSTKCTVCKHKKCEEMFDADFLDEPVDADYCGDCCNEFEDVCGECITRRAKRSKGNVRRCACGQVCCVHKLRGILHMRCVSTPTVE
jgi:hypothetical protein